MSSFPPSFLLRWLKQKQEPQKDHFTPCPVVSVTNRLSITLIQTMSLLPVDDFSYQFDRDRLSEKLHSLCCLLWRDQESVEENTYTWCRCNERLKSKTEGPTRLEYTGLRGGLEHLKIETRLRGERFESVTGVRSKLFFLCVFICNCIKKSQRPKV